MRNKYSVANVMQQLSQDMMNEQYRIEEERKNCIVVSTDRMVLWLPDITKERPRNLYKKDE